MNAKAIRNCEMFSRYQVRGSHAAVRYQISSGQQHVAAIFFLDSVVESNFEMQKQRYHTHARSALKYY